MAKSLKANNARIYILNILRSPHCHGRRITERDSTAKESVMRCAGGALAPDISHQRIFRATGTHGLKSSWEPWRVGGTKSFDKSETKNRQTEN